MSKTSEHPPAAPAPPVQAATPWWCSPAGIALGFLLPMFCLISYAVELNLPGLTARGIHFLTLPYLLLGAGLILAMALGGWLGQQVRPELRHRPESADVDKAALVIGGVASLAYIFWFREYFLDPFRLLMILTGAWKPERGGELVTGVTSLANGGPVFFAIYAWRRVMRRDDPMPRAMHWMFGLLVAFTAFRVYAWSERLSLIEAVLPLGLMFALKARNARHPAARAIVFLGPFFALPLLMAYFGLAESVRSWSSDTYNGKLDFWDFVVGRMASYYYTSLNNGAGYLATRDWPSFHFEYVFSMLHTAPLYVGKVFTAVTGESVQAFDAFLSKYGDLEFNNPSGFYTVVYDVGIPLAIVYFAITGALAGVLYRRYIAGSLGGALFYPVFFISYLEVFRYPYLGSGRAFAWGVCSLLVLLIVRPGRKRVPAFMPLPS